MTTEVSTLLYKTLSASLYKLFKIWTLFLSQSHFLVNCMQKCTFCCNQLTVYKKGRITHVKNSIIQDKNARQRGLSPTVNKH